MGEKKECLIRLCLCLWHLSRVHADYCVQNAKGRKKIVNPSKIKKLTY